MRFQIEPPLERRHKVGILLMVLAGVLAIVLIDVAIESTMRTSAREWAERDREASHGRR